LDPVHHDMCVLRVGGVDLDPAIGVDEALLHQERDEHSTRTVSQVERVPLMRDTLPLQLEADEADLGIVDVNVERAIDGPDEAVHAGAWRLTDAA
jgi:hypothetical protein